MAFTQSSTDYLLDAFGVIQFKGWLCVPNNVALQRRMLEESQHLRFSIHLGTTNMYQDMKDIYWWLGMKRNVVKFVTKIDMPASHG